MKKLIKALVILMAIPFTIHAQTEESKIKEVVERLFKGMQVGDSAMVRSVFNKDVTMATVYQNRENKVLLRRESSIEDFVKSVGTPRADALNEEIWGLTIQLDGDFAQAWCDYAFYIGKKFSHCGVDAFHLYKTENGWKIFHLADTRRSTNCNIPAGITEKYKN
ncbi:MAG: nuclear transport factor 2 family protein [Cyclobacteriaceae bacterium]|nr:nuclear transport factor 2 family protein [Cyclobacteriaceae bacterium]